MDSGSAAAAVASWAALLADHTRATVCLALLDGRAWTLGELARHARVAVSTLSQHADRLVAAGLLVQHRQGRHRYLQLADAHTASLIEAVAAAAGHHPAPARSLSGVHRDRALAHARTCYDHLAGTVAVAIAEAMTHQGLLTWRHGLALTTDGLTWLEDLGIALPDTGDSRRPVLRACLDFTVRRPHLAGTVGAALCRHAFTAGWITRIGTSRAVTITTTGRQAMARHLGIDEQTLRQPGTV
ncbi:helix-turn-helix transcriptional regulator [Micromonospora sp. MW-13]|uniref:ArsR/SmtB family transcription factor n=1 Tax=Micromonospora sp. MW-13 TaxID=2094022 RepID=UPI000E42E5C0|nr:winged helix-turn-helix domain-containing protein [Micromonospora sp. MW-13]